MQKSEEVNIGNEGIQGAACRVPTNRKIPSNQQGDTPLPSAWRLGSSESRHCFFKTSFFLGDRTVKVPGTSCSGELEPGFPPRKKAKGRGEVILQTVLSAQSRSSRTRKLVIWESRSGGALALVGVRTVT